MTRDDLIRTADRYRWYHRIMLEEGVYTASAKSSLQPIWDFIFKAMMDVDFNKKRVLDVGC